MQFFETVFYFVITLGVLVLVHELGHFLSAKLCGMRVDRFSLGFPPRAFGKTIGETDYCVSWIPIGGYVKIAGMIDESFDTEHLSRPPEPWEFRSKPMWQRMFVISAGVIMNILLAVAIFWGINYSQGKIVRETTQVGFVTEGSPAERAGLRAGDRVLEINGRQVRHWEEVLNAVYLENLGEDLHLKLVRNNSETELTIPRTAVPDPNEIAFGIIPSHTEIAITTVEPGKPAEQVGLRPGDILVALDSMPVSYSQKVIDVVRSHAGKPLRLEWRRDGQILSATASPNEEGRIGVSLEMRYAGPQTRLQYSLFEALPVGLSDIARVTSLSFQQLWLIITGDLSISKNVGGPIKIAQFATQSAELGIISYLGFMALLSISLAILNILPFPALDGGHLLFLTYEAIFRREIPVRIKLGLQKAGFALLLAFMAFVLYNDLKSF